MTNSLTLNRIQRAAAIAVAFAMSLAAAPKVPKTWTQLANYLKGKYVTITMNNGTTEQGQFAYSKSDAIVLVGGKEVPRNMVAGLRTEADPNQKSNLRRLGDTLHRGYTNSFNNLASDNAPPWGLIGVPAVTAYAVVAAPFCALGDLFAPDKPSPQEIEIVADSQ
jgi:hypothetical protein